MTNKTREFILIEKKVEAENVVSLFFKPVDGLEYHFIAGQYVNIKPPSGGHSKSYSISSSPNEKLVRITIKRKGKVSFELSDLNIGDKLFLEGSYGYFYPENFNKDIVMLAGGIGVTPFKSIIKDLINKNHPTSHEATTGQNKVNITLFYSNQNIKDITFFEKLNEITKNNSHIKIVHLLTQEKTNNDLIKEYSRIDKTILKKYLGNFNNKNYFICGSIDFVNSMWKLLKEEGVDELNIFTESFF